MTVTIVPYDPYWNSLFLVAEKEIRKACRDIPLILSHIGSTSIQDMAAKPVIDILGEVEDLDDIDACSDAIRSLGFEALGEYGILQRRFFKRSVQSSFPCPIHLHVYAAGDPQIERHLRFRDYLRAHPIDAQSYEELKRSLALIYAHDRDAYTDSKKKLIQGLDRKALHWQPISPYPHLNSTPRPKTWTREKILSSMEANLFFHMTHLIRYAPEAEYVDRSPLSWVTTPVQDNTFNYALHSPYLKEEETDAWIDQTIAHFQTKNVPFAWWISPSDRPENLKEKLKARHFRLSEFHKGMFTLVKTLPSPAHSLKIERIFSPDRLADFCSIAEQLGLSKDLYPRIWKQIPPCLYQKGASVEIYVGYRNGVPVTTGLLAFYARMAGIYWIATAPAERGKGYASAIMSYLMQRAHEEKYQVAALLASPTGKKLYQKFGFTDLADFYEFEYSPES